MKRFSVGILVVVALSTLSLSACGKSSSSSSDATATSAVTSGSSQASTTISVPPKADKDELKPFLEKLFTMRSNDQQGPAWDLLVPQQQALIPRTKFLGCGGMPVSLTDVSIAIIGEPYEEETTIPGVAGSFPSTAVTVKLTATIRGRETSENLTVHLVDVDGQWRWILSPDAIEDCA